MQVRRRLAVWCARRSRRPLLEVSRAGHAPAPPVAARRVRQCRAAIRLRHPLAQLAPVYCESRSAAAPARTRGDADAPRALHWRMACRAVARLAEPCSALLRTAGGHAGAMARGPCRLVARPDALVRRCGALAQSWPPCGSRAATPARTRPRPAGRLDRAGIVSGALARGWRLSVWPQTQP